MDQLLRNTAAEVRVSLFVDGAPTDADAPPHVTITRDSDGSAVVSDQVSTKVAATTGVYSYSLTPANTASLDLLTANWNASLAGVANQVFTTEHEVVGGSLCSLDAIRNAMPDDSTSVDQNDLSEAREYAETWLEDACGVAFRPRYGHDILDGGGGVDLMLPHPRPLTLRSVKVNGTPSSDLSAIHLYPSGKLYRPSGWWPGRRNVEVIYEHGYQVTPAPVAKAAAKLGRWVLLQDPTNLDERATSITTADASYALVTPGVGGAMTALPEVNMVIRQYQALVMG